VSSIFPRITFGAPAILLSKWKTVQTEHFTTYESYLGEKIGPKRIGKEKFLSKYLYIPIFSMPLSDWLADSLVIHNMKV
jgi:hypothetical protein